MCEVKILKSSIALTFPECSLFAFSIASRSVIIVPILCLIHCDLVMLSISCHCTLLYISQRDRWSYPLFMHTQHSQWCGEYKFPNHAVQIHFCAMDFVSDVDLNTMEWTLFYSNIFY